MQQIRKLRFGQRLSHRYLVETHCMAALKCSGAKVWKFIEDHF